MRTRASVLLLACALPASAQPGSIISIDGSDWSRPSEPRAAPRPERSFPPPEPYAPPRERSSGLEDPWSGPYVGVTGGAAYHSFHFDDADFFYSYDRTTQHAASGVPGVRAGWDARLGAVVLGLEAEYAWTLGARNAHKVRPDGAEYAANMLSFGSARARAGGLINEQVLVFGTAGPLYARSIQGFGEGGAGQRWRWDGWRWGLLAGGGFEFALTRRVTLTTEYLHAYFMPKSVTGECLASSCTPANLSARYKFTPGLDLLRAGVNIRF